MLNTARYLSPSNFGILSFAIAFTTIISVLGDLGLQWYITRDLARDMSLTQRYLTSVVPLKIVMAAIAYGVLIIFIFAFGLPPQTTLAVCIMGISAMLNIFMTIFQAFYQAMEKMEFVGFGQLLNAGLVFVGVILAVYIKLDVAGFAGIYVIASLVTLVFNILVMHVKFPGSMGKFAWFTRRLDMHFLKEAFSACWPIALAVIFSAVYSWADTVILSTLQDTTAAGLYNASYRMIMSLYFIPAVLAMAIFPLMSRYYITLKDSLILSFEKSLKYLFIISLPVAAGTTVLADRFILFFYGDAFMPAALTLKLLIWSIPFYFANVIFVNYFNVANRQIVFTAACVMMALINFTLNIVFIPQYGTLAAGAARVIADSCGLIIFVSQIHTVGYTVRFRPILVSVLKVAAAVLLMTLFIVLFYNINLIFLVIIAAALYFSAIFVVGTFDDNDMHVARQLMGNRKQDLPAA